MSYDLGALVTRLVVEGQQTFNTAVDAAGQKLKGSAASGDDFARSIDNSGIKAVGFGTRVHQVGVELGALDVVGQRALTTIGAGLTTAGIALAALLGVAVAKYADYDQAISKAAAVTGAYGDDLERVRKITIQLGGDTIFTAKEAAEGVTELGKAGISTSDILGGALKGSLDLAAAGELSVADSAEIAATTLVQFKLKGSDAVHVADLLAAGAGKAQGGVTDLAAALKQSGLVASQMGLSVEESTGALAAFASAGLIGSDAGTSFRTMLLALATPTTQQRDLMKQYNIQAYDAQGNFVGLTSLAGQLQRAFQNGTQAQRDYALGIIFGSDAIRAANVLYSQGESGIREWISAVDDAGYAQEIATKQTDNLRGDLERLGGALDSALIQGGEQANGVLRDLIQQVTKTVDGFSELPPELQQIIVLGVALVAGLALLTGTFALAVPKIVEFRAALAILQTQMPNTLAALRSVQSFLLGPWGIAIAAATLGVTALVKYLDSLKASGEQITATLKSATSAADIFATAGKGISDGTLSFGSAIEDLRDLDDVLQASADQYENWLTRFDSSHFGAFEALKRVGTQLGELASNDLPSAQRAFNLLADETDGTKTRLWQLLSTMPDLRDQLIVLATANGDYSETMSEAEKKQVLLTYAMGDSTTQALGAADAYLAASNEADGLRSTLEDLLDALSSANDVGQDAITSNIAYQDTLAKVDDAIQKAREGVEGYALTLDTNTAAGRTNMGMLVDLADDAWAAAEAQLALDGNTQNFQASLEASRQAVIDRATQLGYNADEASRLADQIIRIPTKKEIEILANTAKAMSAIDAFVQTASGKTVTIDVKSPAFIYSATGGAGRANGGVDYITAMGNGGVMSNAGQLAQVRRAGDLTVWAEHETGGEAYIPFALAKRGRSEAILAYVASLFGGAYVRPGTRQAADGLVDAPPSAPPSGFGSEAHVHFHNPVVRDPVKQAREAGQIVKAELDV